MDSKAGWWQTRSGVHTALASVYDEEIPGGSKFAYTLGGATLLTFLTLVVTGVWELFYYVPSTSQAYNSLNFLRFSVPFGWLIHGIHFWAATVMVILVGLHLAQTFLWGAFKKPRELTWLLGLALFVLTLGSVFTGGPLAWDNAGYWAARVGSSLAGSVPLVGGLAAKAMFGGETLGQLTLSRLFPIHIAIIPLLIGAVIVMHLVAFRRGGAAGSIKPSQKVSLFWPKQVIKDLLVFAGILTGLVGLAAFLLTPVTGPADPTDFTFIARPDWPFLWVYQILKVLPGALESVGFLLIPGLLLVLIALVPWLDRTEARSPAKRPVSLAVFAVVLVALGGLTWMGLRSPSSSVQAPSGSPGATPAASIEPTPPAPGPSVAVNTIGSAEHGAVLYVAYCQECHGPQGKGGVPNPLSADGTVPELNPIDPEIKGKTTAAFAAGLDEFLQNGSVPDGAKPADDPKYKMPSFGNTFAMSQPQIANVEAYVMKLNGVKRDEIVSPGVQPKIYFWWTLGGFVLVLIAGGAALVMTKE